MLLPRLSSLPLTPSLFTRFRWGGAGPAAAVPMTFTNLSPVRVLGALLGVVFALAATVAQANDIIVCKGSDATSPVPAGTSFSFTLDGTTTFSLTVDGTCMQFASVGVGDHIITEAANSGTVVSAITVSPGDRLGSSDLASRTVTAEAVEDPTPTTVTFVNAAQSTPPSCVYECPPIDLAGRPLVSQNTSATQLFCRYQTVPNDFFCKYFLDTGLLKQDHDDGRCPPVAIPTCN